MASASETQYPELLPATWLAERMAVDPARIDAMRRGGELIAVRERGSTEWRYPAWQFAAGKPRAVVPAIVREARARGLDETRLYEVMTMRMGLGGTRRLADLLVDGEDEAVLAGIRSSSPRQ